MATLRISVHTISSAAVEAAGAPVLDLPPVAAESLTVGVAATASALTMPGGVAVKSGFVALYGDADMLVSAGPSAPGAVEMFLPAFTPLAFRVAVGSKIIARTA